MRIIDWSSDVCASDLWVDTRSDLVGELFAVVGRFRRQLRRSTGGGFDRTGLTQSQAELLRLVGRRPDISVRETAAELGLAAHTASTLVSRLAADDMLTRTVDSAARRVGRIRRTDADQVLPERLWLSARAWLSCAMGATRSTPT